MRPKWPKCASMGDVHINQKLNFMLVEKKDFTMADALQIQLDQLRDWKLMLSPEHYIRVLDEAIEQNKKGYKSPNDVWRGCAIEMFIYNEMMKKLG